MADWQPIDFHGIVTLNRSIINELNNYLEKKEDQLAHFIAEVVHLDTGESVFPALERAASPMTLPQGVELLGHRIKLCAESAAQHPRKRDWGIATAEINQALWEYVELLEGMVTELFQQLDQIGFERWGGELIDVLETVKALLLKRLQSTEKALEPLEEFLRKYRELCEKGAGLVPRLKRLFQLHLLDNDLRRNIVKTEKYLGFRYQTFMHRVEQFDLLRHSTEQSVKKFEGYQIFGLFEEPQKEGVIRLYQWLRIWELNQTTKSLPDREPIRAVRDLIAPEKALQLFRVYERTLREALFNRSRLIKLQPHALVDMVNKIQHQHILLGQMAELHTLGTLSRKYRDFLLRTDPNPYIRSRLGFGEWIVGPEPAIAKKLMDLIFDIESLDELFKELMASIEEGDMPLEALEEIKGEVQKTLHEMSQPLASYPLMSAKGRMFVQELKRLNELGTSYAEVVSFVGDALSRALRSDWKFHVLHEDPQFDGLVSIHQGICKASEDRSHQRRMQRFTKVVHEIQEWVKNNDTYRHLGEIEVDISDLKGDLQDFLAYVQRVAKEAEDTGKKIDQDLWDDISSQLLEYRFLFGRFFHHLRRDKAEERVIRNQFLFVDQYFESIEHKLYEVRTESGR